MAANPWNAVAYVRSGEPTVNSDAAHGINYGGLWINSGPNVSPGTAKLMINLDPTAAAAKWVGLGFYDSGNNFWAGRGVYGAAIIGGGIDNIGIGALAGRNITSGNENICLGGAAGENITTGAQNILIGQGAGAAITGDTGHICIGVSAGLSLAGGLNNWSVLIGNLCASNVATCGSSIIIGRGAAYQGTTSFVDVTIVGHGAAFYGDNLQSVTCIGNQAGGNTIDGLSANYGTNADIECLFIGQFTGKASGAARSNCIALGDNATIGTLNGTAVIGKALVSVQTSGKLLEGQWTSNTVNSNTGTTLTAHQLLDGRLLRTGSFGAPVTDTTPTAASILATFTGNGVEQVGGMFSVYNSGGNTYTLSGGSGVSISGGGAGATIANNTGALFFWQVTNSGAGTESVAIYRMI